MKVKSIFFFIFVSLIAVSCNTVDKKTVGEILKNNPEVLTDAIKANPEQFIDALNEAVKIAQQGEKSKREGDEKKKFEESFNNPMVPEITKDDVVRGTRGAPLVLVEYSDFECPFCKRGYETVNALLEKYKGKIQFVYKHLPLSFHPNAMPAAKYYEALRLQSHDKAGKFHDELFDNFEKIKLGEKFFKATAIKVGADMNKLQKDLNSPEVKAAIDEDLAEAKKFGFQGTPGFLINGIPVKGAYPPSHFDTIIEQLKKKGKVKI